MSGVGRLRSHFLPADLFRPTTAMTSLATAAYGRRWRHSESERLMLTLRSTPATKVITAMPLMLGG
jgi:hypothetical protein